MAGFLSGPGQHLPTMQFLYPAYLHNGEYWNSGAEVALAPGQELPIARGRFWVYLGPYCVLQYFDPVSETWRMWATNMVSPLLVDSDGVNFRVANLTGCAVGAIVTSQGTGYVQGSTTAVPSYGNSQWQPIIGGAISTSVSIVSTGTGYTVPPICFVPPPPPPGVQAKVVANISGGTIAAFTVINQGAGYQTAPSVTIVPNPTDPAFLAGSITGSAGGMTTLTGAGELTAMLLTNPGSSFVFPPPPSLTIAGAGVGAAATIIPMWTVTGTSITSGGAGYDTEDEITTTGGWPVGTAYWLNPNFEHTPYVPRRAQIGIAAAGGGTITTVGTINDGGLFFGAPSTLILAGGPLTTEATIALTLGETNATCIIQQAG